MLEPSESDKLFATLAADPSDALALGMLIDRLEEEGKPDAAEYFRCLQKLEPGLRAGGIDGVLRTYNRTVIVDPAIPAWVFDPDAPNLAVTDHETMVTEVTFVDATDHETMVTEVTFVDAAGNPVREFRISPDQIIEEIK